MDCTPKRGPPFLVDLHNSNRPVVRWHAAGTLAVIRAYLIIWLSDKLMLTRLLLLKAMLAAISTPMAIKPFHCFSIDFRCVPRIVSLSMCGINARKMKPMWQQVKAKGNVNP